MNLDPSILLQLGTALGTIAAAWGGTKVALNGTRERVKNVESDMESHKMLNAKQHVETVERLTRIETKLDTQLGPLVRPFRGPGVHDVGVD